ncbi:hypothetical protein [Rhizobium sp. LCM 4573]|uniref:hypothetical protein n=1 Tax=Rhizobium sp. LCM 4573 TaxID=1848291 RepID=UPI0008DA604A|nr:hypothetical protein [Rhizobium sp. LCM 4573]OHV82614.1 hypothetical protein LCM4573_16585 [Rhizobium sp. LCM 4573]
MTEIVISKGPKKIIIEGFTFFEARSHMGVFLGAFSDENAAWGVSADVQIKLVVESILNKRREVQREQWFRATLFKPDGRTTVRYAALVSGSWTEAFETEEDLSGALSYESSRAATPYPAR